MSRWNRENEEGRSVSAVLHYRDGTSHELTIPVPRPEGVIFEGFITAGDARWQPGEAPTEARPVAILFRRDAHKDRPRKEPDWLEPNPNVTVPLAPPHYEQDSRWPPRGYPRSRRRCSTCKEDKRWYFVRSLWATEQPSDSTGAECEECYRKHYGVWGDE